MVHVLALATRRERALLGCGADGGDLSEVAAGQGVWVESGRRGPNRVSGGCGGGGRLVSWMPSAVGKTRVDSVGVGVGSGEQRLADNGYRG